VSTGRQVSLKWEQLALAIGYVVNFGIAWVKQPNIISASADQPLAGIKTCRIPVKESNSTKDLVVLHFYAS